MRMDLGGGDARIRLPREEQGSCLSFLLFALFVRAIISLSALIQGIYKDERTYACSKGHGRTTGIL